MIRAIIFDLDNCLSAADEPRKELLEPVFDAIRRANRGRLSDEATTPLVSTRQRQSRALTSIQAV
jgi:FMN phosphatase YigB (HAD superfamily)